MEFRFNINKLLPKRINKITHTLIPEDFHGDRRELLECHRQLTKVIDEMGEASARAQGLSKPITSALKIKDTDHNIYLMIDSDGNNGQGCVVGLLKTGSKNLFMFDENDLHYQLKPRCVLDFYIHESQQRMGLGNILYKYMLTEENIKPIKLAIDRPSEKFLTFLRKHYGLTTIIPQNNKFVVFAGFFDDEVEDIRSSKYSLSPRHDVDPKTLHNSSRHNNSNGRNNHSFNGTPMSRNTYGRYAAARPPCHMANIIHNTAILGQPTERNGERSALSPKLERPRSLSLFSDVNEKQHENVNTSIESTSAVLDTHVTPTVESGNESKSECNNEVESQEVDVALNTDIIPETLNNSMQQTPYCSQDLSNNQPVHLDLKFYHSPLW